jgi:urease accessory protein
MPRLVSLLIALGLCGALAAAPALAHTGHGASGLEHGLLHPVTGLDHLLAMVCVGVLGVTLGGAAVWALPLTFVGFIIAGGLVGMAGQDLPMVEAAIALSLVVLGLALTLRLRPPLVVSTLAVAFFAIFHGHAHGAEAPESASGLAYAAGFVVATALLHATGAAAGWWIERRGARAVSQIAGAMVTGIGVILLVV